MNILYRFCCFLGVHLPLFVSYFIARRIAEIKYFFFFSLRKTIKKNLEIVLRYKAEQLNEKFDYLLLRKTVKNNYYNFARYMADFFNIPKWDKTRIEKKVIIENMNYLNEALSYGKGVIVITAHLGNWDLAGIITSLIGYKVNAIAIPYKSPTITKIYKEKRESKGVKVILTGSNPKHILKIIKNNEIIAILGDRIFTEKGINVKFMGRETLLPRGPVTLSVTTGAKIMAGFLIIEKDKYKLYFRKMFETEENLSKEEKISFLMEQEIKILEEEIMKYPDQWFNYSPMWE